MPAPLVHREFSVELPIEKAWQHLSRVTEWPSWAKHIRRVEMEDDELGPQSSGTIHLRNGIKSTFSMTGFDPWRNWEWTGRFLWLTIRYDHLFESLMKLRSWKQALSICTAAPSQRAVLVALK